MGSHKIIEGDDMSMSKPILKSLQILRALAAILVVIHHALQIFLNGDDLRGGSFGIVGVDIFFVLSGFIMIYVTPEKGDYKRFLISRVSRIVPLYFLFTTILAVLAFNIPTLFNSVKYSFSHYLSSVFFLPFEAPDGRIRPLLSIGWTLNFELYFYMFFAIFISCGVRSRIFLIAISMVLVSFLSEVFGSNKHLNFYGNLIFLEFIAGMAFAAYLRGGIKVSRFSSLTMLVLGISVFIFFQYVETSIHRVISFGIPALLVLVGAVCFELGSSEKSSCSKMVALLLKVGGASYSLYLSHIFTLGVCKVLWYSAISHGGFSPSVFDSLVYVALSVVFCVVVSLPISKLIELPANRFVKVRLNGFVFK